MEFVGCEKWDEMTRYVSTRWFSLEQCYDCETKRYEALKSMFLSEYEKDSTKCFERLSNNFADPLTELYEAFFTATLPVLTNYNKFLQRSDAVPHRVLPMTKPLVCKGITISLVENKCILQCILCIIKKCFFWSYD